MVTATKAPVASYQPARCTAIIYNGYGVKAMLRSAGYRWFDYSKTWRRHYDTLEDFCIDFPLLEALNVQMDTTTAALMLQAPAKAPESTIPPIAPEKSATPTTHPYPRGSASTF